MCGFCQCSFVITSVLLILTAKYGINYQSGTIIHSMSFENTTVIKQVDIANPFEKRNAVRHSPLVSRLERSQRRLVT